LGQLGLMSRSFDGAPAMHANVPIRVLRRALYDRYAVPNRTHKSRARNRLTGDKVSKYGRKVASELIQNGVLMANVSIFDEGFVKVSGRTERLLGISGETAVAKKTGLGRSLATLATFTTMAPGFNLLSPGQRGRISLTIVTDKRTLVFSTDQVHESAVRNYQKLLGAGQAVLQQIQLRTIAESGNESAASDLGAQLKQISDLHAQGVLSDDEFAAAKGKLLGS